MKPRRCPLTVNVLVIAALLGFARQAAADSIYTCGNVFQNTPCKSGQRSQKTALPQISRSMPLMGQSSEFASEPRARFAPETTPITESRPEIESPASLSQNDIEGLALQARNVRQGVRAGTIDSGRGAQIIYRVAGRLNTICLDAPNANNEALRQKCSRAYRDVSTAQQGIALNR
jgi:hypothetical protein